jgi:hypothetical protein
MALSKKQSDDVIEEGAKARRAGKSASSNPYTTTAIGNVDLQADVIEKYAHWKLGWEQENVRRRGY